MSEPPLVRVRLTGQCSLRALELTLDCLIGQTEPRWVLEAEAGVFAVAGAEALRRLYGDPRLETGGGAAPVTATLRAGSLAAPTWLARGIAALGGAARVRFGSSLFSDGVLTAEAGPWDGDGEVSRGEAPCVTIADRLIIRRPEAAAPPAAAQRRLPMRLFGQRYRPSALEEERPPTLFVVVDTEAEFDWSKPFAEHLTSVGALAALGSAQAIFDRYGLRPTYVIDYPVATDGAEAIAAIAGRGGCAVGAHLHPWTNPPFRRAPDPTHSFPGNLPEDEEGEKLDTLVAAIAGRFGEAPDFYKAGRYGLGPNTARLIAVRGIGVDFSLMPETDLRDTGGPDFRMVAAIPYEMEDLPVLALPMTRADLGPLSRWWRLRAWLDTQTATLLHLRGVLARTGMLERLTLTPEGVDARLQIVLLQTLLARGHRSFVLHFHSPSLAAGHTPYVRNEAERAGFVARIDAVCRWFFEELGGLPGRPWDLLPVQRRSRSPSGTP